MFGETVQRWCYAAIAVLLLGWIVWDPSAPRDALMALSDLAGELAS